MWMVDRALKVSAVTAAVLTALIGRPALARTANCKQILANYARIRIGQDDLPKLLPPTVKWTPDRFDKTTFATKNIDGEEGLDFNITCKTNGTLDSIDTSFTANDDEMRAVTLFTALLTAVSDAQTSRAFIDKALEEVKADSKTPGISKTDLNADWSVVLSGPKRGGGWGLTISPSR